MEPYYFDKKAIAIVNKWIKESEGRIKHPYISLHWYEPAGLISDFAEEIHDEVDQSI